MRTDLPPHADTHQEAFNRRDLDYCRPSIGGRAYSGIRLNFVHVWSTRCSWTIAIFLSSLACPHVRGALLYPDATSSARRHSIEVTETFFDTPLTSRPNLRFLPTTGSVDANRWCDDLGRTTFYIPRGNDFCGLSPFNDITILGFRQDAQDFERSFAQLRSRADKIDVLSFSFSETRA
jgi:hypothetical protein